MQDVGGGVKFAGSGFFLVWGWEYLCRCRQSRQTKQAGKQVVGRLGREKEERWKASGRKGGP